MVNNIKHDGNSQRYTIPQLNCITYDNERQFHGQEDMKKGNSHNGLKYCYKACKKQTTMSSFLLKSVKDVAKYSVSYLPIV
jgi:hypothetical protein